MTMESPYSQHAGSQATAGPSQERKRISASPSEKRQLPLSSPAGKPQIPGVQSPALAARSDAAPQATSKTAPASQQADESATSNRAASEGTALTKPASQGPDHGSAETDQPVVSSAPARPLPPRQRLPPTIDSSLIHQSLCARQAFFDALLSDQREALQPDYKTPFESANDVVHRLLPYHVWHVNEGDIYHILGKGIDTSELYAKELPVEGSGSQATPVAVRSLRKRNRVSFLDRIPEVFPSESEAEHFFTRYAGVHSRAKRLRSQLVGAMQRDFNAPFGQESSILLDRFALEFEREQFAEEQENFRKEKEQAVAAGVSWDELIRVTATAHESDVGDNASNEGGSDSSSSSEQESEGGGGASDDESVPSQAARSPRAHRPRATQSPSTPATARGGIRRGRGRPRKTGDRTAASAHGTPTTEPAQNMGAGYVAGPTGLPVGHANPGSQMLASPNTIPQHPITLVLPLAALPKLSELGITPVPAPHLLPAIRARQAAQAQGIGAAADGAFARYNTAPRPGPPDQEEAALLLGITIGRIIVPGRSGAMGGSGAASGEEMLHISVVLPKLDAFQLSSLAAFMQNMQNMPPDSLPVPADPRGNTAVGAVVAAYVAGGMNVPATNDQPPLTQQQPVEGQTSGTNADSTSDAVDAVAMAEAPSQPPATTMEDAQSSSADPTDVTTVHAGTDAGSAQDSEKAIQQTADAA